MEENATIVAQGRLTKKRSTETKFPVKIAKIGVECGNQVSGEQFLFAGRRFRSLLKNNYIAGKFGFGLT